MTRLYSNLIALPWVIQLEFVHGCNLRCEWCPVCLDRDLQNPTKREYLDLNMLREFCRQYRTMREKHAPHDNFGWPRVEIAMRGEPLLHPNVLKCLQVLRRGLPKCQLTMFSNGIVLLKNPRLLNRLYDAGLNVLFVDCYRDTIPRFMERLKPYIADDVELVDPTVFAPYRKHSRGHQRRVLSLLAGIENQEESISVRLLDNMGGWSSAENLEKYGWKLRGKLPLNGKRCVRPFREFVLWCDGTVDVCCVDWYPSDAMTLGSIRDQTVEQIWYGRRHLTVLRRLYRGIRDWGLCRTCDYFGGYRPGFLQNPFTGADPLRRSTH